MEKLKQYYGAIKSFVVRRPYLTAIVVIVIAGGILWYYSGSKKTVINSVPVKRGVISQTISVTGTVRPASEVSLSFEKSGRVAAVYRKVGDRVEAGSYVIVLDSADISAQLLQAKAAVKSSQAKLEELKRGTRSEDLVVSQIAVQNAINDSVNDIKNSYVNADDAIRNKVDQLFSNGRSATPQFNFVMSDSQLKTEIETGRPAMEKMLLLWDLSNGALSDSPEMIDQYITEAKGNLRAVQGYLDKVAFAVNSFTVSSGISQTTMDGYKAAVALGRTNVTTALNGITASEEKLNNALSQLALKEAGTAEEQIRGQEATVEGAMANVLNLEAQLAKTVIISPITGVVTKQDAKVGEIAPLTSLVSVISDAVFEIETNVPEADIAKIKIGDKAQITLDAYGSDAFFDATVAKIDPAETIIDGVATYKATLQFKQNDSRIRSGMTANTDIFGERRENVLYLPSRTITVKGEVKTVSLVEGGSAREVIVTTGLRGSNGDVEILSGLKEGDEVKTN